MQAVIISSRCCGFQEAVRWLIKYDEQVKQAWTALMEKSPLLKKPSQYLQTTDSETAALWFDEKEWLIQVDWSRDNIPFSVSLQLKESDAVDVDWRDKLLKMNSPRHGMNMCLKQWIAFRKKAYKYALN